MTRERLVHLVDADAGIAVPLRDPLATARMPLAGVHPTVEALLAAERAAPDVVVLDCAATGGEPAPGVRAILGRWHDACVVVTGGTPSMLSRAVAAGARGFLLKPYAPDELIEVIAEAMLGAHGAPQQHARGRGKIVAVYGPKGGSGTSTTAIALAVLLSGRPGVAVALIDLDLQFGDIGVLLDVRTPNSIEDLVAHEVDAVLVDEIFARHESGIRVLPAPSGPVPASAVDPKAVVEALAKLRDRFQVIVCDLPSTYDDLVAQVLRSADAVVLVTTPELTSLKSLSRVLVAKDLHLDDHVFVVANRSPSRGGLTDSEVERSLGRPVTVRVPSDGAVIVDAANRGIPVVDGRIRSRAQRAFSDLAAAVARELELEPRPLMAPRLVEVT